MSPEKQKKLFDDFPLFFGQHKLPMHATCMCWGCEIGDGWEPLLREAAEKVEEYNKTVPLRKQIQATQVKEKFGTLRLYINNYINEKIEEIIEDAEIKSETTCEICGTPGKLRGKGWVTTLCDACDEKRKAQR